MGHSNYALGYKTRDQKTKEVMKEKTSMQMLIEEFDVRFANETSDVVRSILSICRFEAVLRLEMEQEQIEKAFECGFADGGTACAFGINKTHYKSSKEYYQSKYGGEDVD